MTKITTKTPLLQLSTQAPQGQTRYIGHVQGAACALALAELTQAHTGTSVVLTTDAQSAIRLQEDIAQFSSQPPQRFPDWETLPYDRFSPHQDIISDRLRILHQCRLGQVPLLILPVNTLLQKVCPPNFLAQVVCLETGQQINHGEFIEQLTSVGYRRVDQVMEHGEFNHRGALIDLYPMGSQWPIRVEFFDNEVDTLRYFDPDNQRTIETLEKIDILPAHEFPTTKDAIEQFRGRWRQQFEANRTTESIYQQVSQGHWPAGIEYWQSLFFDEMASLFDYLPKNTQFLWVEDIQQAVIQTWTDIEHRYDQLNVDPMRPLLPPSDIWLEQDAFFSALKRYPQARLQADAIDCTKMGRENINICAIPDVVINHKLKEASGALSSFCREFSGKIIFSVASEGRREALLDLLAKPNIRPMVFDSLSSAIESDEKYTLIIGSNENGFQQNDGTWALLCESDLLGEYHRPTRRKKHKYANSADALIRNLAEIHAGQPIVHLDHGVGRYLGLETLEAGGMITEFVTLEYLNQAKLYVPVASLHLLSRYSGGNEETAPLNKLGSDTWSKNRQKAAEKARDVAAELLDVYAKRELKSGFAFTLDKTDYTQFRGGFAFEETPDQANAIREVLHDMCQPKAMDRLVCGDVGFGKTEVAMRAAYLSIHNNKQVTLLVPTTLLAQQHYDNFCDRFANTAARIEVISRFKTPKEQKAILADVAEGSVDILIGTHKLLNSAVKYFDLGLLIVDEEHRFGVRQKEKIKALRADIDILTLTATPIPRTLNMAMSGMRDLSIIATPPAKRLAIKTFVRQFDAPTIKEAILREMNRGGQIYYLHNDVATIEKARDDLQALVPDAKIITAHGQMRERELERIMSDFCQQRFHILVCTTIIETGIDVPSANTIIIHRADHFGLAQLHQLRGRVGRSHHQAYAYLLTPPKKSISKDAVKRLDAIASLEDLGAGFTLASHDLEIRGAGELLGDDQSGQIESIGFTLFMEMLEQAVEALKEGKEPALNDLLRHQTEVELRLPALLPEIYIPDVNIRLSMYKQIASAKKENTLDELRIELIDRFGSLPDASKNLIAIAKLKLKAAKLGIKKIEVSEKGGFFEFGEHHKIDPMKVIMLVQQHSDRFGFSGENRLRLLTPSNDATTRFSVIEDLLQRL
jgi:transcription-repair coupling factor (superfamily II helicase)